MNVRIVAIERRKDAERLVAATGADPYAVRIMAPKGVFRSVVAEDIDNRAANIIKQEMLALGGEASVSSDVSRFKRGKSCVLLMGTLAQYQGLLGKITRQPFGLGEIGRAIEYALSNYDKSDHVFACGKHLLRLGKDTVIMGILNVTPDSFSDGGCYNDPARSLARAEEMASEGAGIIDVGGESTRPGAKTISVKEESARVVPVLKAISKRLKIPLSVDTYKPEVARAALGAGASIVNDISGLTYQKGRMAKIVSEYGAGVVIMHMQGTPRTMQKDPRYKNVVIDIMNFFEERLAFAAAQRIRPEQIVLDPGIGFGKTLEHNKEILRRLREFTSLGFPVLVGASRKQFIGRILGLEAPAKRISGSIGAAVWSAMAGANIVRVHDVRETQEALKVTAAIRL